jgi:hypothetical protein
LLLFWFGFFEFSRWRWFVHLTSSKYVQFSRVL